MERRKGNTTIQMTSAPYSSIFIWVNSNLGYPKLLASKIGRNDLDIKPLSWLSIRNIEGREFNGLIIDHAAILNSEQIALLPYIRIKQ